MIIKITPRDRRTLDLLGVIAAEQELYYGHHVAHILEYYRSINTR
jgi:hypothetical protein